MASRQHLHEHHHGHQEQTEGQGRWTMNRGKCSPVLEDPYRAEEAGGGPNLHSGYCIGTGAQAGRDARSAHVLMSATTYRHASVHHALKHPPDC